MSNIIAEHRQMVASLVKSGEDIIVRLNPGRAHLWHMATGVAGEAGELLDAVKKHVVYNKELDRQNVIEELGDLEFYMEGIRQNIDVSRDEVLTSNYNKLNKRYKDKSYTNEAAIARADKSE